MNDEKTGDESERQRILIVEDERIVARDIQATLRRLGYDVPALASSFDSALEKAAAVRPHLVLQDINIEGDRDGIETALALREQFSVPVIFLTAYSDDATLARAKKALPYGFLLKPFEERELVAAIEMAFYKHETESRLRESEARLRHSEEHLAATLCSIGDGVIAVDRAGQITFINPIATLLTGWNDDSSEKLHLDQVFRLLDEKTQSALPSPLEGTSSGSETNATSDTILLARDGTRKFVAFSAAPLLNAEEVTGTVIAFRDISERKNLEERLRYQAFHDPLTGLPNRALFHDRLHHALESAQRTHTDVAMLFVDMDNFKLVNDSLGHAQGDLMLVEIGTRLQSALRSGDTVARFGGDEFTILLGNASDAVPLAERLLPILKEPFDLAGQKVYSSPSIGVAVSNAEHNRAKQNSAERSADELTRHADAAMYKAKRSGRACYEIYQEDWSETALHRLQLGNDFRLALENDELELHYQPQIHLQSGDICGVEALVRWHHPERGAVSPMEFVPIAEAIGLAGSLGRWVLRRACEQARVWHTLFPRHLLQMSVNISAQQLQKPRGQSSMLSQSEIDATKRKIQQPHLVDEVAQILSETGFEPECLLLEITEDGAMEAGATTLHILNALKSLGISLAIDDFGTGYSNLSYLKEFPLDTLKIDRRFVSGLQPDSRDAMILESLTKLAHALQLKVVAEGAETATEFEQLRDLGCDIVQGFYFAHPMSARDFELFFRNHLANIRLD